MDTIQSKQASEKQRKWKMQTITFLTSQTLSMFGSSLVQFAISWYITLETKSGLMMTLAILVGFLPTLVLSPFAGVWVDRYDRKKMILLADGARALVTLILVILYMTGHGAIWLLFVALAIRALGAAVQRPAVGAFLPQIVPEEQLMRVNGINGGIQPAIMLISPMVSGALMAFASIQSILLIDVVSAGIGISILGLALRVPKRERIAVDPNEDYFRELKDGFAYIRTHHFLWVFFRYYGALLFLSAPVAFLTPLMVTRVFGGEVWRLTAIEVSLSVGMLAGGGLLSLWGGFENRAKTIGLGVFLMGVTTLGLGLTSVFWACLMLMGICGIGLALFEIPSIVMIQETVEDVLMGRVLGVATMISSSMMPLGMLLFGPLADVVSIELILILTGVMIILQCLSMLRSDLLKGKPEEQGESIRLPMVVSPEEETH